MAGTEKRVKIVKAKTPEDQAKVMEDADLVIWAAGYQTNKTIIKDHADKQVCLSQK